MNGNRKARSEAQLWAWGSAAGLGLLVGVLLLVLGGWNIIQAIWMGAVAFLVLGAFNYFVFARSTPPLAGSFPGAVTRPTGEAAPGPAARAAAGTQAEAPPAAAEPAADAAAGAEAPAEAPKG